MQVSFNKKFFDEENINFIKEKLNNLGEIYFQFSLNNLVLGFLNFRYNGNLRQRPLKKGVNRKVILDKRLAGNLKEGNFYSVKNIKIFFFNKYIAFVSGDIEDLTDMVKSSNVTKTRKFCEGLRAYKVTKFLHPLQDERVEIFVYPEKGIIWNKEDAIWDMWHQEAKIKKIKIIESVKDDELYDDKENFLCVLQSMEVTHEKVTSINISTNTAVLKPVVEIVYKKYTFLPESEGGDKEEIIKEVAKPPYFGRVSFKKATEVLNKSREINISLEKIHETLSDLYKERVYESTRHGGNDGYSKGRVTSGWVEKKYQVREITYLVKNIPSDAEFDLDVLSAFYNAKEGLKLFKDNKDVILKHNFKIYK